MNIGLANAIFRSIESNKYDTAQKGMAIYEVMNMETHNSVSKDELIAACKWLWNLIFAVTENPDQLKEVDRITGVISEMPKSCKGCFASKNYGETVISKKYDCTCSIIGNVWNQQNGTRPDGCPLIQVNRVGTV